MAVNVHGAVGEVKGRMHESGDPSGRGWKMSAKRPLAQARQRCMIPSFARFPESDC